MDKSTRKISNNFSVVRLFVFILFTFYAATLVIVMLWGVNISLMSELDYNFGNLFPTKITLRNYVLTWEKLSEAGLNVFDMTINSLWYAAGASAFSLLFSSVTAYVVAKYKFPGRGIVYGYAIITMMIPIIGSSASAIKFYDMIGVLDTPLIVIFFSSSFGQNFVILFATYKALSWEYAEAAFVDGAGHFTVWYKIMTPQIISPMVALFMIQFIALWGDSDTVLLFMNSHQTFASGLFLYKDITIRMNNDYPSLFAGLTICTIPVIVMYICFQKSIMDIQLGGGLKG